MEFLLAVFVTGLGALSASFAGVVTERLHTGESWISGRSRCNSCKKHLSWLELVPVFSWIGHRGRCRGCRARVPYRYALSEIVLALLFLAAYGTLGPSGSLVLFLLSLVLLAVIVLYDLRHTIVPMVPVSLLALTSAGFAALTVHDPKALGGSFMLAGVIGCGFLALHLLSKGRWMGLGDAPVALSLSLLVAGNAISGLLFSFWIGAVVGIGILVAHPKGHRMGIEVPFVPFLAAGYLLAFFTQWHPFLY